MSHIPQRKEKDCLNCGTLVQGRYCHVCGQENVVPKETFWHMLIHFLYDITHFDSKFFTTLKDLLFKPRFLSREYTKGKRASYLHPVKMYVFTSAIFFLIFFTLLSGEDTIKLDSPELISGTKRLAAIEGLENQLRKDTLKPHNKEEWQRKWFKLQSMKDTTKSITWSDFAEVDADLVGISFSGVSKKYKSVREYDSIQQIIPKDKRDGWFMQRLVRKEISINNKYRSNPAELLSKLEDTVLHRLPYMLFVSLPLFALLLKLIYIRKRQFYYADHGIFTVHFYIFSFILLLLVFTLNELSKFTGWGFIGYLIAVLFIALNFYLYQALRVFYGQGRLKTFIKYLLTAVLSLVMMLVLLLIFFFFSAYEL